MQIPTSSGRKLYLILLLTLAFAMALSGCAPATSPAAAPTSPPAASPMPTELPTLLPVASPTPSTQPPGETPTPEPTPITPPVTENLVATLEAGLPPTPTPDASGVSFGGFEGVAVMPLTPLAGNQPLWAAFTHGTRSFELLTNHFVAVYTYGDTGWQELGRLELECPDSVHPDSVRQVPIEPGRIWLEVQGGAGTYSSCYDLLSFDGRALRAEVSTWSPIPSNLGQVTDVNGDGALEVVLDASDPYVLSRSHGVRYIRFQVLRWDGSGFVEIEPSPLPASAQAELRELNNRAVELAGAGLWLDAQAAIDQALTLAPHEPGVTWNAALIGRHAESNREQVRSSPYPLLTNLFLGDYAAALEVMRFYSPEEIFSPQSPVVRDADAAGWEAELNYWITTTVSQALGARPDLAAAYFLRGWATHLVNPDSPEVLADVERAAALRPDEPLFSQGLAYLKGGATGVDVGGPSPTPGVEIVLDNAAPGFETEGTWYLGDGLQSHDGDCAWAPRGTGNNARWNFAPPATGTYEVFAWWCGDPNHDQSNRAGFSISAADGVYDVWVNLQENAGQWNSLGRYPLAAGQDGFVNVNGGYDGNVVADAVKFVYVDPGSPTVVPTPLPTPTIIVTHHPPSPLEQVTSGDLSRRLNLIGDPFYSYTPLIEYEPVTFDDCRDFPGEGCSGSRPGWRVRVQYLDRTGDLVVTYRVSEDYRLVVLESGDALADRQRIFLTGYGPDGRRFEVDRSPDGAWRLFAFAGDGQQSLEIPLPPEAVELLQELVQRYSSVRAGVAGLYGLGDMARLSGEDQARLEMLGEQLFELIQSQ